MKTGTNIAYVTELLCELGNGNGYHYLNSIFDDFDGDTYINVRITRCGEYYYVYGDRPLTDIEIFDISHASRLKTPDAFKLFASLLHEFKQYSIDQLAKGINKLDDYANLLLSAINSLDNFYDLKI